MSNVLEVRNISKSFKEYGSEVKRIASWFGLNPKPVEEHHILKTINFALAPGEAVGIVGQNGAGKSTLLKMITGTLKPSSGSIYVAGRISAILELGMGFHPDLTGRQNIYHSAGLMGYNQAQIDAVIDDVEAFAEVGEYFDQPLRTYSSGMQMRIAFGVVTAYRPEILIVDEALSVGDAYFQHKSLNRIKEFQKQGTSLLFVSHDRNAIQAVCNRAILIDEGNILRDGDPEEVMDFYNALTAKKENSTVKQMVTETGKVSTVSGSKEVTIEDIKLFDLDGNPTEYIKVGQPVKLIISINVQKFVPSLTVGYALKDRFGQLIFGTNTHHHEKSLSNLEAGTRFEFSFTSNMNLGVGSYSVSVAAHSDDNHLGENYEWRDQALIFNVINSTKREFVGLTWLEPCIEVKHVIN